MAKKIQKQFKILAPGGKATPAPPLGPVLGANGVNPGQFISKFNDATREFNGRVVGCIVTVYADRTFDLEIKSSPSSVLIAAALKIEKGSGKPNTEKVGKLTNAQKAKLAELDKIYTAKIAQEELSLNPKIAAARAAGSSEDAQKLDETLRGEIARLRRKLEEEKDKIRKAL